jgi:GNAT superfamily N-acetyltransferase
MEGARPASTDDVARLAQLYRQAKEELLAFRGAHLLFLREVRRDPVADSLAQEIGDPERGVWVGTIDDFVVGYASGRIDDLPEGERLGVIEELFVEAEARSVGVGEVLAHTLIAWFEDRGCTGADALALPGARATKNFFEESGFTARLLVMHRRLKPNGPAEPEGPEGFASIGVDGLGGLNGLNGLDGLDGLNGPDGPDGLDG